MNVANSSWNFHKHFLAARQFSHACCTIPSTFDKVILVDDDLPGPPASSCTGWSLQSPAPPGSQWSSPPGGSSSLSFTFSSITSSRLSFYLWSVTILFLSPSLVILKQCCSFSETFYLLFNWSEWYSFKGHPVDCSLFQIFEIWYPILFCLCFGSLISYRHVFVLHMELWIPSFKCDMSQLACILLKKL